jgi:hypothetical protein
MNTSWIVTLLCSFDNSQLSLADFAGQVMQGLNVAGSGYACLGCNANAVVMAQWMNGTFQNGETAVVILLTSETTQLDDTVVAACTAVVTAIQIYLSTTGNATVLSATIEDNPYIPAGAGAPVLGNFPIL